MFKFMVYFFYFLHLYQKVNDKKGFITEKQKTVKSTVFLFF